MIFGNYCRCFAVIGAVVFVVVLEKTRRQPTVN